MNTIIKYINKYKILLFIIYLFSFPVQSQNISYTEETLFKQNYLMSNMYLKPSGILNLSVNRVLNKIEQISKPLQQAASRLFWILCAISLVSSGIKLIFQDGTIQNFCAEFIKIILIIGIFEILLNNGPKIGADIIDSMIRLSESDDIGISECADKMFTTAALLIDKASAHGLAMELIIILEVLFIIIIMSLVIIRYAVMYVSAYFICAAGVFVLGFGALTYTRDLAINYIKMLFSIGLQLMSIMLICKTGFSIFDDFISDLENSPNISFMDTSVLIFTALFIYGLISSTPQLVGQLIMGANLQGDLHRPYHVGRQIMSAVSAPFLRGGNSSRHK